ncbi:hypothetical protein [Brevundimonas diminuta]|uniref:hypothetical protein n=1 Tax=Brevundimonas diminuta TaxID=293 RepID=UPI00320A36F7
MDRNEVIAGVAGELHAAEKALDDAINHAATLVQAMISARSALSISAVAGAASQAKAMETIAALSTAREAMIGCHAELEKDHRRLGYGTYAAGPLNKPNEWDSRPMGSQERHLRVA